MSDCIVIAVLNGIEFLINYLRQKWWQMPELYVAVSLYWECRYAYPVQLWTIASVTRGLTARDPHPDQL